MEPTQPSISVIIPHLNQPDQLAACLASLSAQRLDHTSFEIIVIDNGSASLPLEVMGRYPGTILLQETKPGPGPARNRGVDAASGEILAFIDADCRAHADWLKCAVETLDRAPPHTILGGDVKIWREPNLPVTAIEAYESVFAYRFKLYIEQHGFCGTGNLVVRRSDFERIGPFRGIDIAEDIDWGQRACAAGYKFKYVSGMIVFHPARETLHELLVKWDRHIQHAVNAGNHTAKWQARWLVRAAAVLLSPALDWLKIFASDRVNGAIPKAKALLVLVIVRTYRAYKMVHLLVSRSEVQWNRKPHPG